MNKLELVGRLADRADITKKESKRIVDSLCELIMEGIVNDGIFDIHGLLRLTVEPRDARYVRNPKTQERILRPGENVIKLRVGAELERKVNP